jgi:hypothetical protein
MAKLPRDFAPFRKVVDFGLQVSDMDDPCFQHCATIGRPAVEGERELADGKRFERAMMGDEKETVALAPKNLGVLRLT